MSDIDIIGSFSAEPTITGQLETTLVIQGNVDSQFPAQVSVDSVTTGDPGTDASVVNAGTPGNARLQFTIPRGATGAQGNTGPQGDQGPQGAQGEQGEKGDPGDTGATGPANTLTIGTVEDGASADATITGTAPNQTLNLTLPKGDQGDTGDTGPTGATGAKGDKGDTGDTGPQGIKGDKGDQGDPGADGVIQSITAGDNITVDATDPANLIISSTASGSGDMLAANNLSDLVDVATARTNLGLGTAATTSASAYATAAQGSKADSALQSSDVGTTAGKIVALDGSGKLPAVDGSQLTNLPSGSGDVIGPATNADLNIPQWDGNNTKKLKDGGLAVGTSGFNIPQLDSGGHLFNAIMGASSIGASGYYTLPGGLIIQWAKTGTKSGSPQQATNTFPIAFPNNVFGVVCGLGAAFLPGQTNCVVATSVTTSGFTSVHLAVGGTIADQDFYIAVGN